jgi:hypothetical protein
MVKRRKHLFSCLPQKNAFEVLYSCRVTKYSSQNTKQKQNSSPDAATEWKNRGSGFLSQGKIDKNIPDPVSFKAETERDGACRLLSLLIEI